MRYLVIVEERPTSYAAYVPDFPGCIAVGDTRQEVLTVEILAWPCLRVVGLPSSTPGKLECRR
jgi:hypothetical protein